MNQIAELFYSIGEPYAAGLFEEPDKGYFYPHPNTVIVFRMYITLRL